MARTKEFDEDAILQKAMNLFWSKGYNATSAQDLVDKLGISRSSLYDTFTDKYNLFISALNYYRKEVADNMVKLIDETDDVEQMIKQIFQTVIADSVESKLTSGCFMVNAGVELGAHDKKIAALVNESRQDVEDAFYRAVKKGQEKGVFSTKHSARSLARFLHNSITGIRASSKSGADKKVLEDVMKISLAALK